MKTIAVFTLLVFIIFTIDSCHSQGGGGGIAANIGAYLTLYREREKKRKEAEKNRRPQSNYHNSRPSYYGGSSEYYGGRPDYYGERPDYYGGRPLLCFGFFCNR